MLLGEMESELTDDEAVELCRERIMTPPPPLEDEAANVGDGIEAKCCGLDDEATMIGEETVRFILLADVEVVEAAELSPLVAASACIV